MSISKQSSQANCEKEFWRVEDYKYGCALLALLRRDISHHYNKKFIELEPTKELLELIEAINAGPILVDMKLFLPTYNSLTYQRKNTYPVIPFDEF